MWWIAAPVVCTAVAFAVAYQDWLLPSRRRIGYEEMRRSVREVKTGGPPDHS